MKFGPISQRVMAARNFFQEAYGFLKKDKVSPALEAAREGTKLFVLLRKETVKRGDQLELNLMNFLERGKAITLAISKSGTNAAPAVASFVKELEVFCRKYPSI